MSELRGYPIYDPENLTDQMLFIADLFEAVAERTGYVPSLSTSNEKSQIYRAGHRLFLIRRKERADKMEKEEKDTKKKVVC